MENALPIIAVLGGTGKEGKGLAFRWAKAGYRIFIGSRQLEKARAAVAELRSLTDQHLDLTGMTNPQAAQAAEILVLTVPYEAHRPTLETLRDLAQGKILIDVTVPLDPVKKTKVFVPLAGSAALEARQILGEGVEVVDAFQVISYERLLTDEDLDCDVLVSGTSKAARQAVLQLVAAAGLSGIDAGPVENTVVVEGLASILMYINRQHGVRSAGIRITGIPRETA